MKRSPPTNQSGNTDSAVSSTQPAIGFFERYLTIWVALCIVGGILLGLVLPPLFHVIGRMEVAQVNLPVGVLIWVMIIPMLVRIDLRGLDRGSVYATGYWKRGEADHRDETAG